MLINDTRSPQALRSNDALVAQGAPRSPTIRPHVGGLPLLATPCSRLIALVLCLGYVSLAVGQDEDRAKVVVPADTMTESQQDRVTARTLAAAARELVQRAGEADGVEQAQLLGEALRGLQRAWWFQPEEVSVVEEIIPLAAVLRRTDEVIRYAVLSAERETVPPQLLEPVAAALAERGEPANALELYRQHLAEHPGERTGMLWLEIGRLYLVTGQARDAAELFAQVRDALADPRSPRLSSTDRRQLLRHGDVTYSLLGEGFLRAQRFEEAETMFRAAHEAKPNAAMLGFRLAQIHREAGRTDEALRELSTYFAAKTTAAGMLPYLLLADLLVPQTTPPDGASDAILLDHLRRLAQDDPHNVLLGYFLANQLRQSGELDEAESSYRQLLARSPTADAHQGLVDIYRRRRNVDRLLQQLGEVVEQTGSLEPSGDQVELLVEDAPLRQAMADAVRAMLREQQSPPSSGLFMAVALLEAEAGSGATAQEFYQHALRSPGPAAGPFAVNFGFRMLQMDEPHQAAAAFQHVLDQRLLPDQTAEVAFYLSGAWALAGDFEAALQAARQAAELDPTSARMAARVAWVLFQAGRSAESEQAYRDLLKRFDAEHDSSDVRQVMRDARLLLSAICVEQARIAEAEEWLQQVLDEFPGDIGALNDLGYLWCDQGKHLRRAYRMAQEAVEAEPDNLAYRDTLGWALYRLGRHDEALAELRIAAAGETPDGVILDHLGDVYLAANRSREAVEAWRRAAEALLEDDNVQRLESIRAKIKQHAAH